MSKEQKISDKDLAEFARIAIRYNQIHTESEKISAIIEKANGTLKDFSNELLSLREKELLMYDKISKEFGLSEEDIKKLVLKSLTEKRQS